MAEIRELAGRYGVKIIEDASHAIGAKYREESVGCCRYSDATVFSFHPVKIITTAEGGMVLTNDSHVAAKMQRLRAHGITRDPAEMSRESDGPWYYEQVELGFNYRMTDLQAALGLSQMRRIEEFVRRRAVIAARYDEALKDMPLAIPWNHPDSESSRHLYVIRVTRRRDSGIRTSVFASLRAAGIGVNVHYIPVHTHPYYRQMGLKAESCPEALRYYEEAISLPIYASMTNEQQDEVIAALTLAIQT